MNSDEKNIALQLSIEELHRMYDEICENYTNTKNRILTFLAGSLGILAFLYGNGDLFIPAQNYGKIFYWLGLALYIIAISLLMIAVRPVNWDIPTDFKEHKELKYKNAMEFKEYIRDEYITSISSDNNHVTVKNRLLTTAFVLLVIGGIVLVVLKNFNTERGNMIRSSETTVKGI